MSPRLREVRCDKGRFVASACDETFSFVMVRVDESLCCCNDVIGSCDPRRRRLCLDANIILSSDVVREGLDDEVAESCDPRLRNR